MQTHVKKKMSIKQKNIGERLKAFRKSKNINIVKFSELLGISHGSLSGLENNKSKPSTNTLVNLCRNTDINIYWLFTGEGEMIRQKPALGVEHRMPVVREEPAKYTVSDAINIADRPREQLKQWIDDFWKDADEDERAWLIVEMKRQFPEFADWLKKTEQQTSEPDTSSSAGANTA